MSYLTFETTPNRLLSLFTLLVLWPALSTAQTAYNGVLDYAGCGSISGWLLDWNRVTTPLSVGIYNNGGFLTSTVASNYRGDLATGGDDSTKNHGFVIGTPGSILDAKIHAISARYESTPTDLNNSPQSLTCHAYNGYLDTANLDTISGWALDWYDGETPITVDIYDGNNNTPILAGVLANIYYPSLQTGGDYNSKVHGFSIQTPAIFADGQSHTIVVKYNGSTSTLQNNYQNVGGTSGGGQSITAAYSLDSTWVWGNLYYSIQTLFPRQNVIDAANKWNNIQNSFTLINGSNPGFYYTHPDFYIFDNNQLDQFTYGQTDYLTPVAITLNHPNFCNVCYTSSVRVSATIQLNRNSIIALATARHIPPDTAARTAISHEIGHVLNLKEPSVAGAVACSSIKTIMYFPPTLFSCANDTASVTYGGFASALDGQLVQGYYGQNAKNKGACGYYDAQTSIPCTP